jgi:hypothetical protein
VNGGKEKMDEAAGIAIREARKLESKPIIAKEIEDSAWFHNLLHDLGKYVYHRLVKYVDWGAAEIESEKQAFAKLSAAVDDLMRFKDKLAAYEKVKLERDIHEMYLITSMDPLERLTYYLKAYKWYSDLMVKVMCPRCKQQL